MFAIRPVNKDVYAYDPFGVMDAFRRTFSEGFPTGSELCSFRTDVRKEGSSYVLDADLPGFAKEDIKIELNGDMLSINAERSNVNDQKDENGAYIRRERSFGKYSRSFDVSGIDTDNITAAYNNGVLTLTMPQKPEIAPTVKRLEIN